MPPKFYNFIYSHSHRAVFAYVPKVACSNWKAIMRYLAGFDDHLDTALAHDRHKSGLTYLDGLAGRDEILNDGSIKKLACVRNPYSRVLSAYLNKIESRLSGDSTPLPGTPGDHFADIVQDLERFRASNLDPKEYPTITFEVFLRWLSAGTSHFSQDEHWRGQSDLLCFGDVTFDYIGRFENLNADAPKILKAMGCDIDFPTQRQIKFAPTDARSKIETYYDRKCEAMVQKIYADDFRNYGYGSEPLR